MLDVVTFESPDTSVGAGIPKIPQDVLETVLSQLSNEELCWLEDDLDFCGFTGIPSVRVLKILARVSTLDPEWQRLLDISEYPEIPMVRMSA